MRRKKPHAIADVLAELIARRGYGRCLADATLADAWLRAAGEPLGRYTRAAAMRRGVLEVTVANSLIAQELLFQKARLLESLTRLLPEQNIRDVRFRVGTVS